MMKNWSRGIFCIVTCKAAYNLVNKEIYSEKFGFKSYRPVNFSLVMDLIEVHVHMYLLGKMLLYDRLFAWMDTFPNER